MFNIMNYNDTVEWLKKNTFLETDTFMLDFQQVEFAVKHGMILQVPGHELFTDLFYSNDYGRYKIEKIYRVPDEIIKENLLIYPYRVKATMIYESELFKGLEELAKENLKNIDFAITELADYSIINQ